jgi:dihydroorotate dehydrogenase
MYKRIIKPIFFLFNPEFIHKVVFGILKFMALCPFSGYICKKFFLIDHPALEKEILGMKFKNPVGLAAGMDKDGEVFSMMGNFGFGFIELGTTTPLPQQGNPRPRLFRLPKDKALINRMGFNNRGIEFITKKLAHRKPGIIIGGNIGKNKITPNEEAVTDYLKCFDALYDYVDYFAINVSSPNTPDLRALQEKEPLTRLLRSLQDANAQKPFRKPILLKIAPDLTEEQLDDIIEIVQEVKLDGIIATNTTIERPDLVTDPEIVKRAGAGGLSGMPVKEKSTLMIRYITKKTEGKIPVIGAGGILSEKDALEKLEAGASLIQIYTGFVYEGPGLIKRINQAILKDRGIDLKS